jgi:hypothetical protein
MGQRKTVVARRYGRVQVRGKREIFRQGDGESRNALYRINSTQSTTSFSLTLICKLSWVRLKEKKP